MFSLQYGFGIAASQTYAAVTLAEFFELLNGKVPTTGVLRSSPFAKIVGLGSAAFLGVILGPLRTANYLSAAHFFLYSDISSLCSSWYFDAPRPDGAGLPWLSHTERTALSVLDDSPVHAH
jgi:hypothetical protein